jgi:outer membrane lipoprotein SlyB
MLQSFAVSALVMVSLLPAAPVQTALYHPGAGADARITTVVTHRRHRRHPVRKTVKRVGIGAAGGAAVGALAGGGKGAAIGAVAGGGAGAIYDHHEKKQGK